MTDIKILALDLDGTLFTHDKQVTAENRAALAYARERGIKVVITTGRPLAAIGNLLEDLDLVSEDDYSITFNGGLVQRNTGEILSQQGLKDEELDVIFEALKAVNLPADFLADDTVYSVSNGGVKSLYHQANPMLTFIELDSYLDLPRDIRYNKVVSVTEAAYLDAAIAELPSQLRGDFEAFKSREIIFEIMPKGVHKAAGLDRLCQHLGLDASQVMAMGDEENDLSMLTWAGWGVAMANATPEVKAVAKAVTTADNDHSGVAEAVRTYIK
ncbi:Cof-type HAD-IIB family hydrolase [Streptococcus caprae]|uniref:Cof-type HAD-IIB family hydrolase n=1 Tax=Streptococcus caprae TaxID=1640501 RepID=A0ABV8CX04_9STRE